MSWHASLIELKRQRRPAFGSNLFARQGLGKYSAPEIHWKVFGSEQFF